MDIHTYQVLELDKILTLISEYADSTAASGDILGLTPGEDREKVRAELRLVSQAKDLLAEQSSFPPLSIPPSITALGRLDIEGAVLTVDELLNVASVVRIYHAVKGVIQKRKDVYPGIFAILDTEPPDPEITKEIERAIEPERGIKDDASPALGRLKASLRDLRKRIVRDLENRIHNLDDDCVSQEASITLRNGRYVLPIKGESRRKVGGIIHDKSRSGLTYFIEPSSIVELNNGLKEIDIEIEREKLRILQYLSGLAVAQRDPIQQAFDSIVRLDSVTARARYSEAWGCSEPVIDSTGILKILQGRHPVLLARLARNGETDKIVPLDLEFQKGEKTLLISGPNAGGKTVMLKTVGLLILMSLCGLHIPAAAGTVIPFPDGIYVDIGDEQSIENDLSTFSSHVLRLIEILGKAREGTLVLLDEVGVGTDPAEGIVLARAALEDLNERGARTVATTHYTQLKGLADPNSGIVNGSLSFDPDELVPTFRFSKGLPGRSMGLSIGERLGLPDNVMKKARSYLDEKGMALEDLLGELERLRQKLLAEKEELERNNTEVEKAALEIKEEKRRFNQDSREALEKAREGSRQAYLDARKELEEAIRSLNGGDNRDQVILEARRRLEEGLREASFKVRTADTSETGYLPAVGERVMLTEVKRIGRVVGVFPEKSEVLVEVGGKRLKISSGAIKPVEPDNGKNNTFSGSSIPVSELNTENDSDNIDIRGCTRDEVNYEISRAIDSAVINDLKVLKVIHGKGTGVLRDEVSRVLSMDGRVRDYRMGRPWEGGSGVTIVEVSY